MITFLIRLYREVDNDFAPRIMGESLRIPAASPTGAMSAERKRRRASTDWPDVEELWAMPASASSLPAAPDRADLLVIFEQANICNVAYEQSGGGSSRSVIASDRILHDYGQTAIVLMKSQLVLVHQSTSRAGVRVSDS